MLDTEHNFNLKCQCCIVALDIAKNHSQMQVMLPEFDVVSIVVDVKLD